MAVGGGEIKPSLWRNRAIGRRLPGVHGPTPLLFLAAIAALGCRVLAGGLPEEDASQDAGPSSATYALADAAAMPDDSASGEGDVGSGEPAGVIGSGCADGTREGFRDDRRWPRIAGCAGGFARPGVVGILAPMCNRRAGDGSDNPTGAGCSAADLCAGGWHVCRDGADVAASSPTGCEGCVKAGEPRFFLVAAGAWPSGACAADPAAATDLHGCGGKGQPEVPACAPLVRRMGFADCLATKGVWSCGATPADRNREAALVSKSSPSMGGVLCCKD